MLGGSAELTVLLHRSLSAQSGFVFHYSEIECFHASWSDLYGVIPLLQHFVYFMILNLLVFY